MSARESTTSGATSHQVYLGLGSNLGDRDEMLRTAVTALAAIGRIVRISSIWDTAPMLMVDQPRFHNIAVEALTTLEPVALLHALKRIERDLGRQAGARYGPRTIDIDILLYEDEILELPQLTIPHARLAERAFALAPLAEIAPEAWHPVLRQTVRALAEAAPTDDVRRLGPLMS